MSDDNLSLQDIPGLGKLMSSVDQRFWSAPPPDVLAQLSISFPELPDSVCTVLAHIEHESARVWMANALQQATVWSGTATGRSFTKEAQAIVLYAHARADLSYDACKTLREYLAGLKV